MKNKEQLIAILSSLQRSFCYTAMIVPNANIAHNVKGARVSHFLPAGGSLMHMNKGGGKPCCWTVW